MPRYNFKIIHLNHQYISSNRKPTLIFQNHSPFECLFNRTPDYDFLRTSGCLCFPFLGPYHAHKLDFCSSPYVFLGYSSSHLGYCCLDLASQCIYVSRHVCFHENVFLLAKSEQITPLTSISTQPTHLPTLITSLIFHPAAPPLTPPSSSVAPLAPQTQPPTSSPLFATIPPSHNHALMSPSACFSDDHYACTSSPSSELYLSKSVTTASTYSMASSLSSTAVNTGFLVDPSASIQLFDDLSSFLLQLLPSLESSPPRSAAHQHLMVLHPLLSKTTLLTASAASCVALISLIMSSPTSEPIAFFDANRYEACHGVMCDEIQANLTDNSIQITQHPAIFF